VETLLGPIMVLGVLKVNAATVQTDWIYYRLLSMRKPITSESSYSPWFNGCTRLHAQKLLSERVKPEHTRFNGSFSGYTTTFTILSLLCFFLRNFFDEECCVKMILSLPIDNFLEIRVEYVVTEHQHQIIADVFLGT